MEISLFLVQGFNHLKFLIIMRSAIPVGQDLQLRNHGIAGRFDKNMIRFYVQCVSTANEYKKLD